jgi:caspase domain-containing protein
MATDVVPAPDAAPATPSADSQGAADPTPVLVQPRPSGGAASRSSGGGGRGPAPAVAVARPNPPRPVPFGNLAAPGSKPDVWAVVVGIQAYQGGTHHTVGGAGDAAAFMDALGRAGWPANHILELTDGAATGGNIRQAMQWLVAHSGPNTFTLFHFSGHVCIQSTGPCGAGHKYLWSVENQFISDDELGNSLRGLQGKAWVDISGCEAAAFDKGISNGQRLFTGSSTADEKSYEHPGWHESVWTGLAIDQGMLQGQADSNGDHRVTVQEAVRWAQPRAREATQGQSYGPQDPVVTGGSGDYDLAALAEPPPPPPPPPSSNGGGSGGGSGGGQPQSPPPACNTLTKGIFHC